MKNFIKTFAFAAVFGLLMVACSGTVPNQLVGTWNIGSSDIFKITSDRKFTISGSEYEYVIMSSSTLGNASGTIVVGIEGNELGMFNYSIIGSKMIISNGTAAFTTWTGFELTSSDAPRSGIVAVPNQLVGTWSSDDIEVFRITSDGKFFIGGTNYEYVIASSSTLGAASGTIVVSYAGNETGSINYSIRSRTMTISNGIGTFESFWNGIELTVR